MIILAALAASPVAASACESVPAEGDDIENVTSAPLHGSHGGDDDGCERSASEVYGRARRAKRSERDSCRERDDDFLSCRVKGRVCGCEGEKACLAVAARKLHAFCEASPPPSWPSIVAAVAREIAHCKQLCKEEPFDLEACAAEVPVRTDLPEKERQLAYQIDIGSYCGAAGASTCTNRLIAQANVDYATAATQVVSGQMTPAMYLALSRDRTRKLRAAEKNAREAATLCSSRDEDGDWVPDSRDRCPSTPDLAPTDDVGCPLTAPPPGPSGEAVRRLLATYNIAVSPSCKGAYVPERIPAGAFYYPSARDRGTYILAGAVRNQPAGCPVWYDFEIEEITGDFVGFRYNVAFLDSEAKTDLVDLGRPVPNGFVQFNPKPNDPVLSRARLGETGGRAGIRYRVRAVNGLGLRGIWSEWKTSDRSSCTALGFQCGNP
ncbi:MAG: hypothetical protein KIT84_13820 [Labilithrix sp.]|nr:hypothetical protein [Labilithrix sp.]